MNFKKTLKHKYHRLDYSLGKSLFGNTVGLQNNLSGSLKSFGGDPKSAEAKELQNKGFYKLGQIYDDSFIDLLKNKFNNMIEDDKYSFANAKYGDLVFSRQLKNEPCPIPEFSKLLNSHIKNLMSDYFGGNFQVKRIVAARNYHIPPEIQAKREFISDHWHNDNRDIDSYWKAFILLSDVTEDDGPLHLQTRERTKELIKMKFGTRDNYNLPDEVLNDPKYIVKHIGPPGAVIIGNPPLCFHKAGIPAPGHFRDMIFLIMAKSQEPPLENWLEHQDLDPKFA